MIELKNVYATQGTFSLSDICCRFEKGCLTAILGENGSGKSTLLRCIAGVRRFRGSITIDGRDITSLTAAQRASLIALLPQTLPESALSVKEYVSLARLPHTGLLGYMSKADRDAVDEALSLMRLESFGKRSLSSLSGGEMRRAAIAQALAQGAQYILLDEPTASLDPGVKREIWNLAAHLSRDCGKGVIMVTHDINEAVELSDRVLIMQGGCLRFIGSTGECLASALIEDIFGMRRFSAEGRTLFV